MAAIDMFLKLKITQPERSVTESVEDFSTISAKLLNGLSYIFVIPLTPSLILIDFCVYIWK